MKFLFGSIALILVLAVLFFLGLATNTPGIALVGFCSFSLFANPLLWVAIYRVSTHLSRKYTIVPRRG